MNNSFINNLFKGRLIGGLYFNLFLLSFLLLFSCSDSKFKEINDSDLSYTLSVDNSAETELFFGESIERLRIYCSDSNIIRVLALKNVLKDKLINWPYIEQRYNLGKAQGWKPLLNKLDGELRLYKSSASYFQIAIINNKYYSLILLESSDNSKNFHLEKIIKKSSFLRD
jgi:hypothetical protein